jgi:hypothetical protein
MTAKKAEESQGNRKAALARFRRMATLACEYLPAEKLNWLTYHMAVHLDVTMGFKLKLMTTFEEELAGERAKLHPTGP